MNVSNKLWMSRHGSARFMAIRILVTVALCLCVLAGCSKKKEPGMEKARSNPETIRALAEFEELAESARTTPPPARLGLTDFSARIHQLAYASEGRKDPHWDREAEAFLVLLSENFGARSTELAEKITRAGEAATEAGCEDPLVRFLILRHEYEPRDGGATLTNIWVRLADEIEASNHHPYWKYFTRLSAAQSMRAEAKKNDAQPVEAREMFNRAYDWSMQLLKDHSLPPQAMFNVVEEFYLKEMDKDGAGKWAIENIQHLLLRGWGDSAEAWYLIGAFHIGYGWDLRGSGPGKVVTKEGWLGMAKHLGIARIALTKSWEIKPMEFAAVRMVRVERGDSRGRPEMEKWFARAMQLNPASYDAVRAKFAWLTGAWHGNDQEVIAFGRECATNIAWRGRVPLMNYEIHRALAQAHEHTGKGTEEEYWRLPGVWPEVKATFERFFELNPGNVESRYDYAITAYLAHAWDDFRAQLKRIGSIDPEYFGGGDALQQMLEESAKNP